MPINPPAIVASYKLHRHPLAGEQPLLRGMLRKSLARSGQPFRPISLLSAVAGDGVDHDPFPLFAENDSKCEFSHANPSSLQKIGPPGGWILGDFFLRSFRSIEKLVAKTRLLTFEIQRVFREFTTRVRMIYDALHQVFPVRAVWLLPLGRARSRCLPPGECAQLIRGATVLRASDRDSRRGYRSTPWRAPAFVHGDTSKRPR